MSIFAFFGDKGKYNLGNDSDLVGIADGTAFNSIKALAGMIAGIENGATASKTYYKGEYILRNGGLYKVTTTIASGTVITVGVNIEAATIGGEISAINANLADILPSSLLITWSGTLGVIGDAWINNGTKYVCISFDCSEYLAPNMDLTIGTLTNTSDRPSVAIHSPLVLFSGGVGVVYVNIDGTIVIHLNAGMNIGDRAYFELIWR